MLWLSLFRYSCLLLFAALSPGKILASDHATTTPQRAVITSGSIRQLLESSLITQFEIDESLFKSTPDDLKHKIRPSVEKATIIDHRRPQENAKPKAESTIIDLAKLADNDPRLTADKEAFWKGLLEILVSEAKDIEDKLPELKSIDSWGYFTIGPETRVLDSMVSESGDGGISQHLFLPDFRNRAWLRFKLYNRALALIKDRKSTPLRNAALPMSGHRGWLVSIPGYSPERIISPLLADLRISSKPDQKVSNRLSFETTSFHHLLHQVADDAEAGEPDWSAAVRRDANYEKVKALCAGRRTDDVSDLATGQVLQAFFADFLRQPGISISRSTIHERLIDSLTDWESYRWFKREGEDAKQLMWSLGNVLDMLECHLSAEDAKSFRLAREKYGLDKANLLKFEAQMLSDIADTGGQYFNAKAGTEQLQAVVVPKRQFHFPEKVPVLKGGIAPPEQLAQTANLRHRFNVGRGLAEYRQKLPKSFVSILEKLGADSHWIDMGSGEGRALWEYVDRTELNKELKWTEKQLKNKDANQNQAKQESETYTRISKVQPASVTGVTLEMERKPASGELGKARYFTGRYVENIPDKELGKADLITDVVGAFSYTNQIDIVLDKYLRLLKPGGVILVGSTKLRDKIKRPDGTVMDIFEWIKSIPGIEVTTEGSPRTQPRLEIRIKPGVKPSVPKLNLFLSDAGTPPTRLYIENAVP